MQDSTPYAIVGKDEFVDFVDLAITNVPARVDTGARTSTIWASKTQLVDDILHVTFMGEDSDAEGIGLKKFETFETMVVRNSTGAEQTRYVVRLTIRIAGRKIKARFTLADRSTQVYPVLIGRNVLRGKFIVDVKKSARFGTTNTDKEAGI